MSLNKKPLKKANLYLILDAQVLSYRDLLSVLKSALKAGVDIVQLRDKNGHARDVLAFCREMKKMTAGKALFIVNDRADIAMLSKADGIHLGQDDLSYAEARQLMGPKAIIGVSCQNLAHAKKAQQQGADYIGFGSVYKTKTKPDRQPMNLELLKSVIKNIRIPVFAIGGINRGNVENLVDLGVKRIAVCRDILLAKNSGKVIKEFKRTLFVSERTTRGSYSGSISASQAECAGSIPVPRSSFRGQTTG